MRNLLKWVFYRVYYPTAWFWRKLDRTGSWHETKWWIDHLPSALFTGTNYSSYGGWLHTQGMFSGMFSVYLEKEKPKILDFGCGLGMLAPVSSFFLKDGGKFLGIDTDAKCIAACKRTYADLENCSFYLTKDRNAWYPQTDGRETADGIDWPVENGSQDLVTAMSVFTHLQERDAKGYLTKIHDVLAKDGLAMLTFLVVRDYVNPHPIFHFNHPLTPGWFTSNPQCPEMAIGVTQEAMLKFVCGKFKVLRQFEGCVTGGKHPSHQDLLILRKL
jgi:SAM-dependent methyltransferase